MVRVLLCHYFKSQRVFSESYQPTSLCATRQFLFIAVGGCRVFVHSLDQQNFPLVGQFPTISTAVKLICNEAGNYVTTIERRQQKEASTYARVYFNWDRATSTEAVRAVVAGYSLYQKSTEFNQKFLAVELPSTNPVTAIASCLTSGNIIVASQGKLCIYRLCTENVKPEVEGMPYRRSISCDLEHFLDIDPGFVVRGIALCDHFVAFRSKLEVRAIKLVFRAESDATRRSMKPWGDTEWDLLPTRENQQQEGTKTSNTLQEENSLEVMDKNCVFWRFDTGVTVCPSTSSNQMGTASSPYSSSSPEILFRTVRAESVYVDTYLDPQEVLGPMSEVKGHPLKVSFAGCFGVGISVSGNAVAYGVQGISMLYRRFKAEQLRNSDNGVGALHSLQLFPTYTKGLSPSTDVLTSPFVPYNQNDPLLCGMCLLVSGPKEGYMYDVFRNTKLISCYTYACDTIKVSACHTLLHAITKQGLETYTVRMYASASEAIRQDKVLQRGCDSNNEGTEGTQVQDQKEGLMGQNYSRINESLSSQVISQEGEEVGKKYSTGSVGAKKPATGEAASNVLTPHSREDTTKLEPSNSSTITCDSQSALTSDSLTALSETASPNAAASKLKTVTSEVVESRLSDASSEPAPDVSNAGVSSREHSGGTLSTVSRYVHSGLGPLEAGPSSQELDDEQELFASRRGMASAVQECRMKQHSPGGRAREYELDLPVYDLECLKQLCPPPTLDICLIGMYPFVSLAYILCSDESVVLFTRAHRDATHSSKRGQGRTSQIPLDISQPEWSVYVLQNMEAMQLYKVVMPLANRCQKHNLQAYHHLVCEQHMFLRSCCLLEAEGSRDDSKKKKVKKLLCESATNLADIYAKDATDGGANGAEYYNMSGLPLHDVVNRAWKAGQPFSDGLAHYLDEKLFGSDEPVTVSESTAKKIFKIYSKVNPSRVSEIVLISSLNGFSPETAIAALEDLKKADDTSYRITAIDKLVLAILYLHQCEPDQAQAALFSIQEAEMIKTVATNFFLLHEDLNHLTPLAQMLRKHKPAVFLEIVLSLHDSKKLSLVTILNLLGANKPDVHQNNHVLEFLEAVLNDKRRLESFQTAVTLLSRMYLSRILDSSLNALKTASGQQAHNHVREGDGHFGSRYPWLDKLPPFLGSFPGPRQSCPISRKTSGQSSPRTSRHMARPIPSLQHSASRRFGRSIPSSPISGMHTSPGGGTGDGVDCSCCCCTGYLLKLQALLSSPFTSRQLCESILSCIEGKEFKGDMSVRLLCHPRAGMHKKATALILDKFPGVMLPYGHVFFDSDVDKWSHLLAVLLEAFQKPRNKDGDDESTEPRRELLGVLKGTLSRLAQLTSPLALLSLVPDDGALGFFLPYLEQCYRRCASEKLSNKLATENVTPGRFYT